MNNCLSKVYKRKLDNGLEVVVIPKKGYVKYFCSLTVNFGGLDHTINGNEIPYGVAHFLEHKMFEKKDGLDATEVFSQMGVDSNAYTDYKQTSYIISGTKNQIPAISYLLDFVQEPYFTSENVEKEKGIIIQEYKMYADDPSEILKKKVMRNLYDKLPYYVDIVGTIKDIQKINKSTLYLAYNTFYSPSNMILLCIGDFNPEEIFSLVSENQKKKSIIDYGKIIRKPVMDNQIYSSRDIIYHDIEIAKASLALKINDIETDAFLLDIKLKILLEMICGSYSMHYQEMLDRGLINTKFNYAVRIDNHDKYAYGYIRISSDTYKPQEFIEYMKGKLLSMKDINIKVEDFNRIKKALIGATYMSLNDIENIAIDYVEEYFRNNDLFLSLEKIKSIKLEDLNEIKDLFNTEFMTEVIMEKGPKKQS